MRTIKFRGKRIDNNEWVHGYLYKLPLPSGEACMILTQDNNHLDNSLEPKYHLAFTLWVDLFVVVPETVGQFTGLTDKNGKEIYEGDIVQWGDSEHKIKQVVEFRNGAFGYVYDTIGSFVPYAANTNFDFAALGTDKRFEVCGNIHDNSDLIEKGGPSQ